MKLQTCIYRFFDQYLPRIKGSSDQTIKAYRDVFSLFLPFAARKLSIQIASLRVEHLSPDMVLAFLDHLESDRGNVVRTRNHRLAAIKSLAKMIRLMYPENREEAQRILDIPQKRAQKQLIGFLYPDEILKVFHCVNLIKKNGFRDYTILHLLEDSGARASEIATLNLDYFDPQNNTLIILGKGNRYRQIELGQRTVQLIKRYSTKYRIKPKPLYQHRLFINQRGEEITRHGIYRICKKYLQKALDPKRLININPVHSFRHMPVSLLLSGKSLTDIQNRLGHEDIQSTTIYTHMDLTRKKAVQKRLIEYMKSSISEDPEINKLIAWENKTEILAWLDSL
ncbi:MAG: tyrosine-type recombinase/integrase [Desulfobacterales bacterium]